MRPIAIEVYFKFRLRHILNQTPAPKKQKSRYIHNISVFLYMGKWNVILALLLFIISCKGQNIVSGLKDRNGNLWFTVSERGVYRYDGRSFVNFTKQNYKTNIYLSACLYEDKTGNLWFSTSTGLCFYDGNEFKTFQLPLPPSSILGADQHSILARIAIRTSVILQDKNGMFWFLTADHGAYRYNGSLNDSILQEKNFSHFLLNDAPNCILETKKGELFIGSWNGHGVFRYHEKTLGIEETFKGVNNFNDGMIAYMMEDKSGNIWVGTRNKSVDRYDGKIVTNFSAKDGFTNNSICCILEDSKGNVWLGADIWQDVKRGDAFCYNGNSFSNITIKAGITQVEGFVYGVKNMVEDNAGNIWIGSKGGILLRYDGRKFIDFSESVAN
ncbi:MAG: two-component regulator propeller domain-containing protein [Bacteroidota bacterium]